MGLRTKSLLNVMRSDRGLARFVVRHMRREKHYEKFEGKEFEELRKAIESGNVDDVMKHLEKLMKNEEHEIENFDDCLVHLLILVNNQCKRLKDAFNESENDAIKNIIKNELNTWKAYVDKWVTMFQRIETGGFPKLSAEQFDSLLHEITHVARILGRTARNVSKKEKKILKEAKNNKNDEHVKALLDKLHGKDEEEKKYLQRLFSDIGILTHRVLFKGKDIKNKLGDLEKLSFPEEERKELEEYEKKIHEKFSKDLHETVTSINTLFRVIG